MIIYTNGERLDTYTGGVSVQKKNNLWELSTVSMQRTHTIKIPATPHNMALFGFPNDPATTALSDIDFLSCIVDMDGCLQAARLYTTGFDGTDVSAVLVFGEEIEGSDMLNQTLQEILQDVESKGIHFLENDGFLWANVYTGGEQANFPALTFDLINSLLSEKWTYNSLLDMQQILAPNPTGGRLVVAWDKMEEGYYLKPNMLTYKYDFEPNNQSSTRDTGIRITETEDFRINYSSGTNPIFSAIEEDGHTTYYFAHIRAIRSTSACQIVFPDTAEADNLLLATVNIKGDGGWTYFGGREIDQLGRLTGESLRGRSVDIEAGVYWTVLSARDYVFRKQTGDGRIITGWFSEGAFQPINVQLGILTYRANILTKDMIPNIKLYDYFKFHAALRGKFLVFNGESYVLAGFDDLTGAGDDAGAVRTKQTITPKVGNFSQHNKIEFSGGEPYRENIDYTIQNKHLNEEKALLSIKLDAGYPLRTNGTVEYLNGYPMLTTEDGNADARLKKWTFGALFNVESTWDYLTQYPFGTAENFPTNSKQVQVTARMPYYQFAQLRYNTVLRVGLCRYSWVSATWESGWCKLTLQRI